jgi:hypothetical protein
MARDALNSRFRLDLNGPEPGLGCDLERFDGREHDIPRPRQEGGQQ